MKYAPGIVAIIVGLSIAAPWLAAQSTQTAEATPPPPSTGKPVVLDRVIAVINGDVILESDVDEEIRFASLEPFSAAPDRDTPKGAARRIANRTLIMQQIRQQNQLDVKVSDEDVQKAVMDLRTHLPECRKYNCTTEEGWKAFLAAHGLTEAQMFNHWKRRLMILRFIDLRFRSGIRISNQEIEDYYKTSIVPVYQHQNQKPPPLDQISQRIQEILLQQHVNGLLRDWLKTLRHEGVVQILDPAYGESSERTEEDD
jgi:peptidyl-prolyl cis-trans isomerase SurA